MRFQHFKATKMCQHEKKKKKKKNKKKRLFLAVGNLEKYINVSKLICKKFFKDNSVIQSGY